MNNKVAIRLKIVVLSLGARLVVGLEGLACDVLLSVPNPHVSGAIKIGESSRGIANNVGRHCSDHEIFIKSLLRHVLLDHLAFALFLRFEFSAVQVKLRAQHSLRRRVVNFFERDSYSLLNHNFLVHVVLQFACILLI